MFAQEREVMTISVGDRLPSVTFKQFADGALSDLSTDAFFAGRRVLLVGIPGAFTPVCQGNHLPGYVEKASDIKACGIDAIACLSINDTFVMNAFGKATGSVGKITMLADADGTFTKAIGLQADASSFGLGTRSERYAMVVNDGVVEAIEVESNFVDHAVSSADHMLGVLAA
jgi:glutaredoxin/glutathione-dependent peroxiredoxin